MKAIEAQTEMDVEDPRERERAADKEADNQRLLLEHWFVACRAVVREAGGWDAVANALEAIWGETGRHVSAGVLKSALAADETSRNRNYFRFEWAIWFARQSLECAELLAEIIGRGKPTKPPDKELADLKAVLRNEYPRQAERLIRKGETS